MVLVNKDMVKEMDGGIIANTLLDLECVKMDADLLTIKVDLISKVRRLHQAETQKKKASLPLVKNSRNAKCYYINNG